MADVPAPCNIVALNKLILSSRNVRKTNGDEDIESLADSIAAKGLLQNLVVSEAQGGRGLYEVDAGGRRYRALQLLVKRGTIPRNFPVPVLVVPREDATEASLAENLQKIAMNPADEVEAFAAIVDRYADCGISSRDEQIANCARRFGVPVRHVEQRLRLAALAPQILDALREARVTLDAARAYAAHPDQKLQLKVFEAEEKKPENWRHSVASIRDAMKGKIFAPDHPAVLYIGIDDYRAAGGRVDRDMFMGAEDKEVLLDPAIVDRLVARRTAEDAGEFAREDGWKDGVVKPWTGPAWADAKAPKGYRRIYGPRAMDALDEDAKAQAVRAFRIAADGSTLEPLDYCFVPEEEAKPEGGGGGGYDPAAAYRKQQIELRAARLAAPSVAGTPLEGRIYWPSQDWIHAVTRDAGDGTVVVALLVAIPAAEAEAMLEQAEAQYEREIAEAEAQLATATANEAAPDDEGEEAAPADAAAREPEPAL